MAELNKQVKFTQLVELFMNALMIAKSKIRINNYNYDKLKKLFEYYRILFFMIFGLMFLSDLAIQS